MRILFLTPQFPYPPHKGTTLRNYHLIAGLAARHEIDLLTFVESEDELRRPTPLSTFCRRMDGVVVPRRGLARRAADTFLSRWPDMGLRLWSPAFADKLAAWLADADYDVVQVEGIELARYVLQDAGRKRQRRVMHAHTRNTSLTTTTASTCSSNARLRRTAEFPRVGSARRTRSCNGASCARSKPPSAAPPITSSPCPTRTPPLCSASSPGLDLDGCPQRD